jgi:hypothetical protein
MNSESGKGWMMDDSKFLILDSHLNGITYEP